MRTALHAKTAKGRSEPAPVRSDPLSRSIAVILSGWRSIVGRRGSLVIARTVSARRAWRHQLIHREFAIPVLIQRLERRRSIRDFVGIDDAVVVCIQCRDNGRRPVRAKPAGAGTGRGATRRLGVARVRGVIVLRYHDGSRGAQREKCQGRFSHNFHTSFCVCFCDTPASGSGATGASSSSDPDDFCCSRRHLTRAHIKRGLRVAHSFSSSSSSSCSSSIFYFFENEDENEEEDDPAGSWDWELHSKQAGWGGSQRPATRAAVPCASARRGECRARAAARELFYQWLCNRTKTEYGSATEAM